MEPENEHVSVCGKCEKDERISLIKQRMHALNFPNLQALSAYCILTNLQLFSSPNGPFSLRNLPGLMRQMLLRQLASRSEIERRNSSDVDLESNYGKYCSQLLTSHCTHLNLNWILAICPEDDRFELAKEVMNQLRSEACNLESLEVPFFVTDIPFIEAWSIPDFREGVLALRSLKMLKMPEQTVHPPDLVALGQHLPQLELLQCTLGLLMEKGELHEYQEAAIKMVGRMRNLRNFEFVGQMTWLKPVQEIQQFGLFCLLRFPQLETIGDMYYAFNPDVKWEMGAEELKPRFNLTRLNLSCDRDLQPVFQTLIAQGMLPNVQCLTVQVRDDDHTLNPLAYRQLLNFDKLTELTLAIDDGVFEFLTAYGHKLQKLALISIEDVTLEDLVLHCPRLKELYLEGTCLSVSTANTLDFLTKLEINADDSNSEKVGLFLTKLPNLEQFNWRSINPYEHDFSDFSRLIKSGQIFSRLVSLQISLFWDGMDDFSDIPTAFLDEFIKDLCAYAPRLESIKNAASEFDDVGYFGNHDNCCVKKCVDLVNELSIKNHLHI